MSQMTLRIATVIKYNVNRNIFICQYLEYFGLVAVVLFSRVEGMEEYEELRNYYVNAITELLKICNDIDLLDLILRLLQNQ